MAVVEMVGEPAGPANRLHVIVRDSEDDSKDGGSCQCLGEMAGLVGENGNSVWDM